MWSTVILLVASSKSVVCQKWGYEKCKQGSLGGPRSCLACICWGFDCSKPSTQNSTIETELKKHMNGNCIFMLSVFSRTRLSSCPDGLPSIDFNSPVATLELTRVLLLNDFGIKWDLPLGQLVPPLTGRVNYIHWLEDLLELSSPPGTCKCCDSHVRAVLLCWHVIVWNIQVKKDV